ncbi:MAG TPA: hydroxyisourate hydrolase [Ktedonobacterales bacterium]
MSGSLTTHVLDIVLGRPAENMRIELWQLDLAGTGRTHVITVRTNHDGRVDEPLLHGDTFAAGAYELIFDVGEYFAMQALDLVSPPFLGHVPVRFSVADPNAHYHVPLLVSPWAYSTYRGS